MFIFIYLTDLIYFWKLHSINSTISQKKTIYNIWIQRYATSHTSSQVQIIGRETWISYL